MALIGAQPVQLIQNRTATVIQLDASVKEVHSRSSKATRFPIENGDVISDHVIVAPFDLEITGVISDTPIGGVSGLIQEAATSVVSALTPPIGLVAGSAAYALFQALVNAKKPSVVAYQQLLKLQGNASPVDVLTSLYRYPSMWIESISAPREADSGNILLFTVKLAQLILVQPKAVNVQIFANPGLSANNADLGQQGTGLTSGAQAGYGDAFKALGG